MSCETIKFLNKHKNQIEQTHYDGVCLCQVCSKRCRCVNLQIAYGGDEEHAACVCWTIITHPPLGENVCSVYGYRLHLSLYRIGKLRLYGGYKCSCYSCVQQDHCGCIVYQCAYGYDPDKAKCVCGVTTEPIVPIGPAVTLSLCAPGNVTNTITHGVLVKDFRYKIANFVIPKQTSECNPCFPDANPKISFIVPGNGTQYTHAENRSPEEIGYDFISDIIKSVTSAPTTNYWGSHVSLNHGGIYIGSAIKMALEGAPPFIPSTRRLYESPFDEIPRTFTEVPPAPTPAPVAAPAPAPAPPTPPAHTIYNRDFGGLRGTFVARAPIPAPNLATRSIKNNGRHKTATELAAEMAAKRAAKRASKQAIRRTKK